MTIKLTPELLEALRNPPPFGFFVSQKLHDDLVARFRAAAPTLDAGAVLPPTYGGMRIAVDPDLPDGEGFLAATAEAWHRRMAELESRKNSRTDHPYLANALEFRSKSSGG
jgi:hypothetical protein